MAVTYALAFRATNLPLWDRCAKIYGVDGKCKACKTEVQTLCWPTEYSGELGPD